MNRMDRKYTYLVFVLLLGLFGLWGCPKNAEFTAFPEAQQEGAPAAGQADMTLSEDNEVKERAGAAANGLQPVYFDFDQSFIRPDGRKIMRANAEWLKANPRVKIRIEGNCDERGTIEYNQALGQRRAASAKRFLTDLGISAKRISLISYGKEKQDCTESTENCWQKNRKDEFITVSD